MTRLRHDQCCGEQDCTRPARHAALCVAHYLTGSPAVRATADLLDRLNMPAGFVPFALHRETVREALEALWMAPAYGEAG